MKNSISVDDLYVISDLHLGGEPGFQIFGSTRELVWLIEDLAARPEDRKVALLVNGDVVDFLAERDPEYFDAAGATDRLDRILVKDKNFSPILKGSESFRQNPEPSTGCQSGKSRSGNRTAVGGAALCQSDRPG